MAGGNPATTVQTRDVAVSLETSAEVAFDLNFQREVAMTQTNSIQVIPDFATKLKVKMMCKIKFALVFMLTVVLLVGGTIGSTLA